jgi:hypothetical protein
MKFFRNAAIASVLVVLSVAGASAKTTVRIVSFGQDFVFAGTSMKAGTYRLVFDDKSKELTFTDRKSKSVLAKAVGHYEKRMTASGGMDVKMNDSGDTHVLTSVAFPGESNVIVLGGESANSTQ